MRRPTTWPLSPGLRRLRTSLNCKSSCTVSCVPPTSLRLSWLSAVSARPPKLTSEIRAFNQTLGVDLGIINLATDSEGETFSGEQVERNRKRHHALRQRVQKRGTKRAKRHLKKLSGREARFKRNTNHVISKLIVAKAKANGQAI